MLDLIIKNGQCYIDGELKNLDVSVKDGKIENIGNITEEAKDTINAEGLTILPGCIDTQTHFREPGSTDTEDLNSGGNVKNANFFRASNAIKIQIEGGNSVEYTHNLGRSLQSIFADGELSTSIGVNVWRGWVSDATLQPYCNKQGFNTVAGSTAARFGLIMNSANDCTTPDATVGIGLKQGCGAGGWPNKCKAVKVYVTAKCEGSSWTTLAGSHAQAELHLGDQTCVYQTQQMEAQFYFLLSIKQCQFLDLFQQVLQGPR